MEPAIIALICAGAAAATVALAAAFVLFSNNCITVSRYNLSHAAVREQGVKIVHISDVHGKRFGKGNRRLIKKAAAEQPDFIAVTGDIIHKYRPRDIEVAEELVQGLCKIAPVFYVSGNHEMRSVKYRDLRAKLIAAGATVLDDDCVQTCGVSLAGVNCAHVKSDKFFNLAEGREGVKILLAHLPQYIDRYALAGYDFALCGHAHGGQWRIPFTKVGVYAPGQGLFPKYTSHVHSCGDMRQVISRGLGNSQCPLRLFNRPEVVVISLKKE